MQECLLAGPGRPLALAAHHTFPRLRSVGIAPAPGRFLRAASRDLPMSPMVAGEGRLRRQQACMLVRTCVYASLAFFLATPPACAHACVHSFMHERTAYGRKACRVALPLSFVGGLANGDVDVRLVLDQSSGAARCSRQGTAITTDFGDAILRAGGGSNCVLFFSCSDTDLARASSNRFLHRCPQLVVPPLARGSAQTRLWTRLGVSERLGPYLAKVISVPSISLVL